jgi:hypothetical protein
MRPWRRTDLLEKRIADYGPSLESIQQRLQTQQNGRQTAMERHQQAQAALDEHLRELESVEQSYRERQRVERPTSRLTLLRKRVQADRKRCASRKKAVVEAEAKLAKTQTRIRELLAEIEGLRQRLKRFQEENLANPQPIAAEFRLDAGFGSYQNIALLIEMGYEVYTKPHGNKTTQTLRKQVDDSTTWTRVGANAEMVAWSNFKPKGCPYALDMALERF